MIFPSIVSPQVKTAPDGPYEYTEPLVVQQRACLDVCSIRLVESLQYALGELRQSTASYPAGNDDEVVFTPHRASPVAGQPDETASTVAEKVGKVTA